MDVPEPLSLASAMAYLRVSAREKNSLTGQPITIDIYCRTAAADADALAKLQQQEAACRAYCEEHRLLPSMVHFEVASGSTYRDRELLTLMRTRYRDSSIQGVVTTGLDRLSRSVVDHIILLQEMEAHNVTLYCVDVNTEVSPIGRYIRMMVGVIAAVEREKALDMSLTDSES